MPGMREIAAATLAGLLTEFASRLISFVKLVESGHQKFTESDYKLIGESEHPLMVTFRKDLGRIAQLQAKLIQHQLMQVDMGLRRLSHSFDDFKISIDAVDFEDRGSSWNFFDSGLDIFLKELEEIVQDEQFFTLSVSYTSKKWDLHRWGQGASTKRVLFENV